MEADDLRDYDVILIDGRSGSGKTSLTERLANRFHAEGRSAQILHVEDLYPGWDGLAAGSRAVAGALADGAYRRYDWVLGGFAESVPITDDVPLIIEGCGAITAENLAAARAWAGAPRSAPGREPRVHGVWIDCPAELRRSRALARDGETFRPYWERWAAQEEAHYAVHKPWVLADEVLRVGDASAGAATVGRGPDAAPRRVD